MYQMHSAPLNSWASTVAQAAPATPMWNRVMNRISSAMFSALATIRKYSGVRLSPTARRTLAKRLNSIDAPSPAKITPIYPSAPGKISSGVCSMRRMWGAPHTVRGVSTRVARPHSAAEQPKLRRTPSASPAPKRWAVVMEKPAARPWAKPITKKFSPPVQPTAASAPAPSVRPTIKVSAML